MYKPNYAANHPARYYLVSGDHWGVAFECYATQLGNTAEWYAVTKNDPQNKRLIAEFEAGLRLMQVLSTSDEKDSESVQRAVAAFSKAAAIVYPILAKGIEQDMKTIKARLAAGKDVSADPLVKGDDPESAFPTGIVDRTNYLTQAFHLMPVRERPLSSYRDIVWSVRNTGLRGRRGGLDISGLM